MMKKTNW